MHQRYLTVYNRKVRFCAHERPSEVRAGDTPVLPAWPGHVEAAHLCAQAAPVSSAAGVFTNALARLLLQCHTLEFDVVGHPRANFCFSVTFPFHPYKDGRKGGEVRQAQHEPGTEPSALSCARSGVCSYHSTDACLPQQLASCCAASSKWMSHRRRCRLTSAASRAPAIKRLTTRLSRRHPLLLLHAACSALLLVAAAAARSR